MANPLVRFGAFTAEIQEELKQVSWPTRDELVGSALVVFVGVFLLGVYISACDFLLSRAARALLR